MILDVTCIALHGRPSTFVPTQDIVTNRVTSIVIRLLRGIDYLIRKMSESRSVHMATRHYAQQSDVTPDKILQQLCNTPTFPSDVIGHRKAIYK